METNLQEEKRTCSFCSEELVKGYIWLSGQQASLKWQVVKPKFSRMRWIRNMQLGERLLATVASTIPETLRVAYKCKKCGSLLISQL